MMVTWWEGKAWERGGSAPSTAVSTCRSAAGEREREKGGPAEMGQASEEKEGPGRRGTAGKAGKAEGLLDVLRHRKRQERLERGRGRAEPALPSGGSP